MKKMELAKRWARLVRARIDITPGSVIWLERRNANVGFSNLDDLLDYLNPLVQSVHRIRRYRRRHGVTLTYKAGEVMG